MFQKYDTIFIFIYNNNTRLTDLFRDYPGELVPER